MHDPTTSSTIRIAILGGGLAGVALLKGLLKYPHIAADLYEARPGPALRDEAGPAVELSAASLTALRLIDPSWNLDLDARLVRAGALLTATEVRLASGPRAGQRVQVPVPFPAAGAGAGPHKTVVGRQALLAELAAGLPPRALHFNKRVTAVREIGGGEDNAGGGALVVVFGDGSQKRYDVVIGADRTLGGVVRKHVLSSGGCGGSGTATNRPRPTGFWGLHVTVPLERAQSFLGETELRPTSAAAAVAAQQPEVRWVGDGTFMQHGLVNGGRDVQVVAYARLGGGGDNGHDDDANGGEESPSWVRLFTPDEFEAMFAGCQPVVCKGIVKLFRSVYTVHIPGLLEMQNDGGGGGELPNTITTAATRRCTTLLTPATTTTPPFPSPSTASTTTTLAIEEALVLSTLLGAAGPRSDSTTNAIPAALRAFEAVCRPRARRAARLACETTALLAGCAPGVGLDAGKLAGAYCGAESGDDCGGDGGGGVQARLAAAVGVMEQQLLLLGRQG
ncbi:hypothetical protein SLS62_007899 [Diatrype stigma]|uniref:Uncharacterized protein n=1 Tax=Diatrype stigma TaxID=117547 RepID=A0AAN9ULA1_9PEZI